jgi:hypothetical protein
LAVNIKPLEVSKVPAIISAGSGAAGFGPSEGIVATFSAPQFLQQGNYPPVLVLAKHEMIGALDPRSARGLSVIARQKQNIIREAGQLLRPPSKQIDGARQPQSIGHPSDAI